MIWSIWVEIYFVFLKFKFYSRYNKTQLKAIDRFTEKIKVIISFCRSLFLRLCLVGQ